MIDLPADVHPIGRIVRLQVQRSPLKVPVGETRRYSPVAIAQTERLVIDANGATGFSDDGRAIIDVHRPDHPASRYRGDNSLSIGFTSHYTAMRDRFGAYMGLGVAGESIIVDSDRHWCADDIRAVMIETAEGLVTLTTVIDAPPCVEFARFALGATNRPSQAEIADALRFLSSGTRGLYARYDGPAAQLSLGASVYALLAVDG